MTSGYRNSASVDSDDLFDPDVKGDGYTATFLKRSDGTPLKYALAAYGTPGDAFGYRDETGADVGPKWAKKGTAKYFNWSLPPLVTQTATGGKPSEASITLRSDGTYAGSRSGTFVMPNALGMQVSASQNGAAYGPWIDVGTNPRWFVDADLGETASLNLSLRFRRASDGVLLYEGLITLTATSVYVS